MVKVALDDNFQPETPSQQIVRAAAQPVTVTDKLGRVIGIRKLNALDRMRLFEIVGSDNSKNDQYLGHASLAYAVVSIDGDPIPAPSNKRHLEALVQRLDDDGLAAIGLGTLENFASERDRDAFRDKIKNS